ncbi:hypothetical protein [Maricaulis sp.]|uniref:hypothetical protein n=1 Tax=Maricaulis sp. TaxID=1486257 RepID=UPI002631ECE7|nr:hypothetical protein [Maricaulis sp.]
MRHAKIAPKSTTAGSSFRDWMGALSADVKSASVGVAELPFQRWRRFKEAFSPELVVDAIQETESDWGCPIQSCFDPFGGSGTTALTCQFWGIKPYSVEVNPYLSDLIEAKLATYEEGEIITGLAQVLESLSADSRGGSESACFEGAPASFVEPGTNGKFIFSVGVAARLVAFRNAIESISSLRVRRLFRVLLSSIAVDVSNVVVSGKGRRYRRNWQALDISAEQVDRCFVKAVNIAIEDIYTFADRAETRYSLTRGSCLEAKIPAEEPIDLSVFSPPYPNSFDYTDVYNVELWVGGYLKSSDDNRNLRMGTLRSHVQLKRPTANPQAFSKALEGCLIELNEVQSKLWNKGIPQMVGSYFADMESVLLRLHSALAENGRVYMTVGDSQYAGVHVPVARVLCEIAPQLSFEVLGTEKVRAMRASPQQGGRAELPETLIKLQRSGL